MLFNDWDCPKPQDDRAVNRTIVIGWSYMEVKVLFWFMQDKILNIKKKLHILICTVNSSETWIEMPRIIWLELNRDLEKKQFYQLYETSMTSFETPVF